MCSNMSIPVEVNFSPLYTVTSRNVTSVLLASKVNLIVLWIFGLFVSCRCDVKVFIWGSPDDKDVIFVSLPGTYVWFD